MNIKRYAFGLIIISMILQIPAAVVANGHTVSDETKIKAELEALVYGNHQTLARSGKNYDSHAVFNFIN